jgi:hypothetical protein
MIGHTDPPQTKTTHTTQKTKMIGNTDPPQTKTKHTTQKTKMTSKTDLCVVCFVFVCGGSGGWVSVLLVILVFCVVGVVFVCGGQEGGSKTHNTEN